MPHDNPPGYLALGFWVRLYVTRATSRFKDFFSDCIKIENGFRNCAIHIEDDRVKICCWSFHSILYASAL